MYEITKSLKHRDNNFKALVAVLIGLALVTMIPITDIIYAKPKFDQSTLGKHCSNLNSIINALLAKQSHLRSQGQDLSASDRNSLNQAIDEYMSNCYQKYGYPSREVNPKVDDLPIIEEDMVLEQTEQPESPKQGLPDISQDDMVIDDSEQQTQPSSEPDIPEINNEDVQTAQ